MNLRLIESGRSATQDAREFAFHRESDDMYVVVREDDEARARAAAEGHLREYDESPGWLKTKERTLIKVGAFYAGGLVSAVDLVRRRIEVCSERDWRRGRSSGEKRVFAARDADGPLEDAGWA